MEKTATPLDFLYKTSHPLMKSTEHSNLKTIGGNQLFFFCTTKEDLNNLAKRLSATIFEADGDR